MVRLDSTKIKVPIEAITSSNDHLFTVSRTEKGGILQGHTLTANDLGLGINRTQIDIKNQVLILELSAKVLKSDYSEGINQNTFERAIDSVNNSGIITLDKNTVYDSGEVLRCDVTDNISIDSDIDKAYNSLSLIPLPNKYEVTPYKLKSNRGVVLKGKQKSFKERQIFYDKLKEIFNTANGRKLIKEVPKETIFKSFKDTIRVESNFTQLRKIREYMGSNELKDILTSTENVNLKVFNKITKQADVKAIDMFTRYEGMNVKEVLRLRGVEGVISDSNNNWDYLELWLRHISPNNYRKMRKEFREVYNTKWGGNDASIITLIKDSLKRVA